MTTNDENQISQAETSAEPGDKKPYQSPELAVHGRVDEITQFLAAGISGH